MKMIFVLLSLCASSAMAAVTQVQQNLNPAASQNEINGTFEYDGVHAKADGTVPYTVDGSGITLNGTYFFGLTENQAIGAGTGYMTGTLDAKTNTTTSTTDTKGLNDLAILYKGNFDLGFPTLFVKGGLHFSTEDNKSTRTSAHHYDSTASSGRNSLDATVGMVFPYEVLNWGFSGTYTKKFEGKSKDVDNVNDTTDTATLNDGDESLLSVFAEFNNVVHPNVSITYHRMFTTKYTYDDPSITSSSMGSEVITVDGRVRFVINPHVELMPYLALSFLTDNSKYGMSEYNVVQTGVIGRFLF